MLIQIHILQNYAPSNLNRDDTGSPKDAMFGGYRRGRISSQCLKRSIRKSTAFIEAFKSNGLLGVRTKLLPGLIATELSALGASSEVSKNILARVPDIGRKRDKNEAEETEEGAEAEVESGAEGETRQLIFIGQDEIRPLTEKLLALYKEYGAQKFAKLDIKVLEKAIQHDLPRSMDIAMFGRMTTSEAFEDVQASVQVAHALSTNALAQEFDYYTAVDDLSGQSGAGMIGDVEFNSSTYYKYVNVHWEGLVKNLGGDKAAARQGVLALIEAAATAQPSGKQNSCAAQNLPDLVVVEVSAKNLPVSYANAFIKPAKANSDLSLLEASTQKLSDYIQRVSKTFNLEMQRSFTAIQDYAFPAAERQDSMRDLQAWVGKYLPE